ncbi:hypothetical protein F0562_014679 [Nyssa sinensis]|uniref:Uncharacterized protein n=1 Tax=Nyssa sinensis TaxID=561372 RepID=A0A5J4ZNF9_9ASTE|nr:hypothetical protein F0562_014679 [Nyssa sinensis]
MPLPPAAHSRPATHLRPPSSVATRWRNSANATVLSYNEPLPRPTGTGSHPLGSISRGWTPWKRVPPRVSLSIQSLSMTGAENDEDVDDFQNLYENDVKPGVAYNRKHHGSISNGIGSGSGFRIRIPGQSRLAPTGTKIYRNFDESPNPNFGSTRIVGDGYSERLGLGKRVRGGVGDDDDDMVGKKREENPVAEMVSAIKVLGDGFVRMERVKMEMAREVEAMRMETELKRTEMILDSQQRIVEAFAKAFSDKKKKAKRILISVFKCVILGAELIEASSGNID